MKLRELGNDVYKVLEYMKCVEVIHGDEKIIIHTQQEIADDLKISKLKVNKIISQLFYLGLLRHYTKKGKYQITKAGYEVLRMMNTNIKTGGIYNDT
ncbi:hypothetical protein IMSAGC017_01319 [Thomasclavelia cocleata]|uniref:Uncharacterized protein n=1 Tax=Thomasclavelia cocleata TaxID=69824 RepID=A0A829ZB03_9FIRM|nr:hypothetical protein [Thomasclavelia cocleata]GFI41276.1 hypothetical protein IMSAGC017_01319 [Thomasclavelia cocleata]